MQNSMHFDFSGQTVIVTGGTRGIGRAISEAFLEAGATVVALYGGNREAAEQFRAANAACGERLEVQAVDVGDYGQVERFFKDFDARHARLDVLVNNAGIRRDTVVGMMSPEQWQQVLQTNLGGTYAMSKFAVLKMMQARYGRIVTITSPSGEFGFEGQANYAASKAGQVAFSRSLSKEAAKRKITVNCVSPGFIATDLIADLPAEQAEAYRKQVPLRRFGEPAEVAKAVLFLAAPESEYITGATLHVTGGL